MWVVAGLTVTDMSCVSVEGFRDSRCLPHSCWFT